MGSRNDGPRDVLDAWVELCVFDTGELMTEVRLVKVLVTDVCMELWVPLS